jgi:nitroreductase
MDYDGLLEMVKNRRSVRKFKPDPIPDEYVDKIIEVARWSPSGFNTQPWDFVVVKKKELKDRIVEINTEYLARWGKIEDTSEVWQEPGSERKREGIHSVTWHYGDAPVFILLLGDTRSQAGLPLSVRYSRERTESIFTSSLASAFIYMHLAATSLGLASQWVSAVHEPSSHCQIKELLGIPAGLEAYDMMALGYPALEPRPKLLRPLEKMVHYDDSGQQDFRTDAEVRDFARKTVTWTRANHRVAGK